MKDQGNSAKGPNIPAIHLSWVIGLLALGIIAMVVYSPSSDKIQSYISFASTISSILLAVVAIIYSMISNRSFDSTLAEIRSSALSIAEETKRLNVASRGLSNETEQALQRLTDLPVAFNRMSGDLSNKIDALSATRITSSDEASNSSSDNSFSPGGKTFGVNLALYFIYLSSLNTRPIVMDQIFPDRDQAGIKNYVQGVMDSIKYFKVFGIDIDGITGQYMIKSSGSFELEEFASEIKSKTGPSSFIKLMNCGERYFDEPLTEDDSEDSEESDHEESAD